MQALKLTGKFNIESIVATAVLGGTVEVIGGGKFANGAISGVYIMMLNHIGADGDQVVESEPEPEVEIFMYRIGETDKSTLSLFLAYDTENKLKMAGFFLEPKGPSTAASGQNQRIPEGTYVVASYPSSKFGSSFIISNENVSTVRGILIHPGSTHDQTRGCLLPGSSYSLTSAGHYRVNNSEDTMNRIRSFIGTHTTRLHIRDIQPLYYRIQQGSTDYVHPDWKRRWIYNWH